MDLRFCVRLTLFAATLATSLAAACAAFATPTATLGEGAWSWFADPRAVYYAGLHKRTYVGWVGVHGDIRVLAYDHATKTVTTAVLQNGVQADDHANPALLVRPDGRLQVFYSAHNGSLMFYRVSTRPEDISSWGPVQFMPASTPSGYTYPNPIRLWAEHRTYLFWRAGDGSPTNSAQVFSTEADGSETWSAPRTLIGGADGRAYVKYGSYHGEAIGIAFTNANPLEAANTNVYFAEDRGGRIYKADGTLVGPLGQPIGSKDADPVYDTGIKGWVDDVAFDSTGHPIIAYAVFPSKSDHVYMYARWDGNQWVSHEITHAGGSFDPDKLVPEPYYSGGLSLDHEDPSIVYLSRKVGAAFEIEEWRTSDVGASWTSRTITANSPGGGNYRPVSPRGLHTTSGDLSVVWMSGDYRGYIGYRTSIGGVASSALPVAEYNASSPDSRPFSPLLRGRAPMEVMFDASPSERPSGRIASFSWDFGDGIRATGERVAHRYTQVGDHFATLTVTDAGGAKSAFVTDVVVDKEKAGGGISVFLIALPAALIVACGLLVGYRRRSAKPISGGHRTSVQP